MAPKAISPLCASWLEEIPADVAQEVEPADRVACPRNDLGNGHQDAVTRVVNAGEGQAPQSLRSLRRKGTMWSECSLGSLTLASTISLKLSMPVINAGASPRAISDAARNRTSATKTRTSRATLQRLATKRCKVAE